MSHFDASLFRFGELSTYLGEPVFHRAQSPTRPVAFLIAEIPASIFSQAISAEDDWRTATSPEYHPNGQISLTKPGEL